MRDSKQSSIAFAAAVFAVAAALGLCLLVRPGQHGHSRGPRDEPKAARQSIESMQILESTERSQRRAQATPPESGEAEDTRPNPTVSDGTVLVSGTVIDSAGALVAEFPFLVRIQGPQANTIGELTVRTGPHGAFSVEVPAESNSALARLNCRTLVPALGFLAPNPRSIGPSERRVANWTLRLTQSTVAIQGRLRRDGTPVSVGSMRTLGGTACPLDREGRFELLSPCWGESIHLEYTSSGREEYADASRHVFQLRLSREQILRGSLREVELELPPIQCVATLYVTDGHAPVGGAYVHMNGVPAVGRTNTAGYAEVAIAAGFSREMWVSAAGYRTVEVMGYTETNSVHRVLLEPSRLLEVRVTSPLGLACPGATVRIEDPALLSSPPRFYTADKSGRCLVELSSKFLVISASFNGLVSGGDRLGPIVDPEGVVCTIQIPFTVKVRGRVIGVSGEPLAGVSISAIRLDRALGHPPVHYSEVGGEFVLDIAMGARYELQFAFPGYRIVRIPLPGGSLDPVELDPCGEFALELPESTTGGSPLYHLLIYRDGTKASGGPPIDSAAILGSGVHRIHCRALAPGDRCLVLVRTPSGREEELVLACARQGESVPVRVGF